MGTKVVAKVKSNVIGAVVGAGAFYWASGKYANVSKTWLKVGIALVGAVVGANAQAMIAAKRSTPSKSTVK
jgi:hypothetical protein